MDKFLKILSIVANVMTVLGIGGVLTYGAYARDKNLFGRKIYEFTVFAFRLTVVLALGILLYASYGFPYMTLLTMLKGSEAAMNFYYWQSGYEIQHAFAYSVSALALLVPWLLLSLVIFTASLYYPKRFISTVSGGYYDPDLSPYKQYADLEIVEASYGSEKHNIDVTNVLQSMVKAGRLVVQASNNLVGDPHEGTEKKLIAKYRINGVEKTASVMEHKFLEIPEPEGAPNKALQRIS